jgi:hypothetical protein
MVLSSNHSSAFPLANASGAVWTSRLPSLWILSAAYHDQLWRRPRRPIVYRPLTERTAVERAMSEVVLEDLERGQPDLLLVLRYDPAVEGWGGATGHDYLRYLDADPRFRGFLSGYRDRGRVGGYQLFKRVVEGEDRRSDATPPP